jgi:hypothetical protein
MLFAGSATRSCHLVCPQTKPYEHPEYFGGRCFAIPVPKDAVDALRSSIKLTRKAALQWVPEEFDTIAWQVYELLGSPTTSAETAWDLFTEMASLMR